MTPTDRLSLAVSAAVDDANEHYSGAGPITLTISERDWFELVGALRAAAPPPATAPTDETQIERCMRQARAFFAGMRERGAFAQEHGGDALTYHLALLLKRTEEAGARAERAARPTVDIIGINDALDWHGRLVVLIDGEPVACESYGCEPEDQCRTRDLRWIEALVKLVAERCGANVTAREVSGEWNDMLSVKDALREIGAADALGREEG
jgi:hypothetical protein